MIGLSRRALRLSSDNNDRRTVARRRGHLQKLSSFHRSGIFACVRWRQIHAERSEPALCRRLARQPITSQQYLKSQSIEFPFTISTNGMSKPALLARNSNSTTKLCCLRRDSIQLTIATTIIRRSACMGKWPPSNLGFLNRDRPLCG